MKKRIQLKQVASPKEVLPEDRPEITAEEYRRRRRTFYDAAGCQWVIVYGDREHLGNLVYLCGFDPRFEEALLVLGADGHDVLMVGAEGECLAAPLAGHIEILVSQLFSLPNVLRAGSGRLGSALQSIGMSSGDEVGVVGWKYLEPTETELMSSSPGFVPGFVVDAVAGMKIRDVTRGLLDPAYGQRRINSVDQVAQYEWGAARASASAWNVIRGVRPGLSELAACKKMGYAGEPLSCHVMLASGRDGIVGLRSPTAKAIETDDGVTLAIGYWGGLTCRAGVVSEASDNAFFHDYVAVYISAVMAWYEGLTLGTSAGAIVKVVADELSHAGLRSMLNPGHTTSTEEWVNSPMTEGSEVKLASGMALQSDIIPVGLPRGTVLNCEDTVALGDKEFRREFAARHPYIWERIETRRRFMKHDLGMDISDDVLPLSTYPACFAPFWLDPDHLCVRA
jgi:hypothetical protein